jgi:hypothetical protein
VAIVSCGDTVAGWRTDPFVDAIPIRVGRRPVSAVEVVNTSADSIPVACGSKKMAIGTVSWAVSLIGTCEVV